MLAAKLCVRCKGRLWCALGYCPILRRAAALCSLRPKLLEQFEGAAPSVLVGHAGYPDLNVGILNAPEQPEALRFHDAPRAWAASGLTIARIVELRASLINSRFRCGVRSRPRLLELGQEVAMASRPVELEVRLAEKPRASLSFNPQTAPVGPTARLLDARLTANPHIPRAVDRVVSDSELKAEQALWLLYERGLEEAYLARLLSIGDLGTAFRRKLVPTRWAITAIDDALSRRLLSSVRCSPALGQHELYYGCYLGNHYLIALLPSNWAFELFEGYAPSTAWNPGKGIEFTSDFEPFQGRKDYAANCAGGYYTVRLAAAEFLARRKRQAAVLALRFITDDYAVPLGVWVTREAARKALSARPLRFASRQELMRSLADFVAARFGVCLEAALRSSKLLAALGQKRIADFYKLYSEL